MLVNPKTVDILRLRSYLIKYLRDFLHERHFLEFQTPILAGAASGATARPFTVTANAVSTDRKLSLRIAPELWLKRLVVGGVDRVFELGPAFRNEGIDQTHNPEFTICEFYQAYSNLSDLISLTQGLIRGLAAHCQSLISTQLTSLPAIDLTLYEGPFEQAEFIPTLESALGFRLPDLDSASALTDLLAELKAKNIPLFPPNTDISTNTDASTNPTTEGMSLPWLLDKLAERYIEPLSAGRPLFITHHPECMSPLAKSFVCDKTGQTVSARAELFVGGRELANMYEEENHPGAQHAKFLGQAWARTGVLNGLTPDKSMDEDRGRAGQEGLEAKDAGGKGKEEILVGEGGGDPGSELVDQSYIRALCSGLPPTGGWGCGVERLLMLFAGTNKIGHCLSFGSLRDVVGTSSHDPRASLFPAEDEQKHRTRRGRRKEVS
jgi:lysyl-tRNA synthetase class 2